MPRHQYQLGNLMDMTRSDSAGGYAYNPLGDMVAKQGFQSRPLEEWQRMAQMFAGSNNPMGGGDPNSTIPSFYSDPKAMLGGGNNFASKIGGMNLGGGGRFGGLGFSPERAASFYGEGGPGSPTPPSFLDKLGGFADKLGGYTGIANIGLKAYGLGQTSDQITNLENWREKLNVRADASAALDKEKFGLVKEEYDTLKTARKANIWAQRPQDPNANPYTNQLVQGA